MLTLTSLALITWIFDYVFLFMFYDLIFISRFVDIRCNFPRINFLQKIFIFPEFIFLDTGRSRNLGKFEHVGLVREGDM